jgi:DNA-directed RNA polymerase specialized sigma24 family protein
MGRPLLYYATSLTGNPDTALDVLQEVWVKLKIKRASAHIEAEARANTMLTNRAAPQKILYPTPTLTP